MAKKPEVNDILRRAWDPDVPLEERYSETERVPALLDRLRELGVVQCGQWQCVFFYPTNNIRPMIMFLLEDIELPQFERLQPFHVYETVNYLMWQRLLEPELALSYRGLFDYLPMPEKQCFYLSACPSDEASDHMLAWFI